MNGCSMGGKEIVADFVEAWHQMYRPQKADGPTGLQFLQVRFLFKL